MLPLWHSLFAQAIDKSPAEIGAGAQAPVETDGYEDVDEEGFGYGYGYGEDWDEWWSYMKKEEEDDHPEETPVKDVEDLGGEMPGWDEQVEVHVEEEPPEPPKKKVKTPELDDGDSTWQGWQSYAGSSRDTNDDEWWQQGSGQPWKNTWWWDRQWTDRDWKNQEKHVGHDRHDRQRSKGKGKGRHAPWAYTNPKGKKGKGRGKVDQYGGQYCRGGYTAPDGTFYQYLVSNLTFFILISVLG